MSSALVYAYVNTQTPRYAERGGQKDGGDSSSRGSAPPVYVPLMNIPRADLRLRPEFVPVLARAGIDDVGQLITVDDVSLAGFGAEGQETGVVLVDGNVLRGELAARFGDQVCGVVDHHEVERSREKDKGRKMDPWVVKQVGSCTSLVVQLCRARWDQLQGGERDEENLGKRARWDAEVARVALASVLIDTRCLKDESKATSEDRMAVEYLEEKIRKVGGPKDGIDERSAYFREVSGAKEDIGGLQLHEILRKDYKQWDKDDDGDGDIRDAVAKLGISSVVKPMRFMSNKALAEEEGQRGDHRAKNHISSDLLRKLACFAKERKLSLYAVMTAYKSDADEFQRELLLMTADSHARSRDGSLLDLAQRFERENEETLGLRDWLKGSGEESSGQWQSIDDVDLGIFWWKIWQQTDVSRSRKQVAPILKRALQQI